MSPTDFREVIVTGGRDYADADMLDQVLSFLDPDLIIHGGASGADTLAHDWAVARLPRPPKVFPYIRLLGRGGGPARNRQMLLAHPTAILVAFPGHRGTADCVDQAKRLGMTVLQVL